MGVPNFHFHPVLYVHFFPKATLLFTALIIGFINRLIDIIIFLKSLGVFFMAFFLRNVFHCCSFSAVNSLVKQTGFIINSVSLDLKVEFFLI